VLLLGALEETHTITDAMVDDTAEELNRDLGTGQQEPAPAPPVDGRDDLLRRIEQLERQAFRQEQVFKRVMDMLEANATGR
jgi:hypothetical protein